MLFSHVDRRVFLRLCALGALTSALGPSCADDETVSPSPSTHFLTDAEKLALGALADLILPPDDAPGGQSLGVVDYVERLLTVFQGEGTPRYFASGPFSDRNPFPSPNGAPTTKLPENAFGTWVPLDRYAEAELRLYLYGSSELPNGGPNDNALGVVVGLRDLIRSGLKEAADSAQKPLEQLDPASLLAVWNGRPQEFQTALIELVVEGALSAPEYGGNKDLAGWKLANFPGDVLPLGYTFFDPETGKYIERADAPVSTADIGPDPAPMDADTHETLGVLVGFLKGRTF